MYQNRHHAGKLLAHELLHFKSEEPIVLALPRGGVAIGYEVAKALEAPLTTVVARKIGLPGNREFGIGAISENGAYILDQEVINRIGLPMEVLKNVIEEEKKELKRRVTVYRENKPLPDLQNKTVILVDDGLATGVTAKAAIAAVKKLQPKKIIFASAVCAYDTAVTLRQMVDEVVCLTTSL